MKNVLSELWENKLQLTEDGNKLFWDVKEVIVKYKLRIYIFSMFMSVNADFYLTIWRIKNCEI